MTRVTYRMALGAALLGATAGTAAAQSSHEMIVQAAGGGLVGFSDLAANQAYDTKAGAMVDGSVGVRLDSHLIARADLAWSRAAIRFQGADFGANLNRMYTSVLAEFPFRAGAVSPYLLAGGGLVFLNQHATTQPKRTFGQAVAGGGIGYQLGKSAASLYLEGRVYFHQPTGLIGNAPDESRMQFDGSVGAGLSYALHR